MIEQANEVHGSWFKHTREDVGKEMQDDQIRSNFRHTRILFVFFFPSGSVSQDTYDYSYTTYTSQALLLWLLVCRPVVADCLPPNGLQHTRPPCPPPTPGACSNSCPLSR